MLHLLRWLQQNAINSYIVESTFLPALQFGDIQFAQRIWGKAKDDQKLNKKLLTMRDRSGLDCFGLVCKYGYVS